jgi:AcrR family transcriptional regulator
MERLLEFAERELNEVGTVKFRVGRVLENAGVSKSSAYHHFGSRDGLIAAVEMKTVSQQIELNNTIIRQFIESAPASQSASEFLRLLVSTSANVEGIEARKRRAATLVSAQNSPELARIIGQTQRDGAEYLASTLQIAVDLGWMTPVVPLLGIAHWILSSVFGRILVDYTEDPIANDGWAEATYVGLAALMRPNS